MGVGSITSMNSISGMWMTTKGSVDVKSKSIENEITDLQQQMQKLSSKEELSVDEKANERKKQQREIASLNTKLQRHQKEFLRSQKKEFRMAELLSGTKPEEEKKQAFKTQTNESDEKNIDEKKANKADNNIEAEHSQEEMPASSRNTVIFKSTDGTVILKDERNQDERPGVNARQTQAKEEKEEDIAQREAKSIADNSDSRLSHKEIYRVISADASAQQTNLRETAIARMKDNITVLKGEIHQDEIRGIDTNKKQAELEKLEKKEEQARAFQFSNLGKSNGTMNPTTQAKDSGARSNPENNIFNHAPKLSTGESQTLQQQFYVSLGN